MSLEDLKKYLAERFEYDYDKIDEKTKIKDDLGADSIDIIEILMMLESDYNIVIPDEKASEIKTVGDVLPYLQK